MLFSVSKECLRRTGRTAGGYTRGQSRAQKSSSGRSHLPALEAGPARDSRHGSALLAVVTAVDCFSSVFVGDTLVDILAVVIGRTKMDAGLGFFIF